jgi:hypothetical protein
MAKSYIGMKFEEFTDKFTNFFLQKKKVRALENYVSVATLPANMQESIENYISHIKTILSREFIDDIEENYLNARINQLEIDAMEWSHRTKWLKERMEDMKASRPRHKEYQMVMPLSFPLPNASWVPGMLPADSKQISLRA